MDTPVDPHQVHDKNNVTGSCVAAPLRENFQLESTTTQRHQEEIQAVLGGERDATVQVSAEALVTRNAMPEFDALLAAASDDSRKRKIEETAIAGDALPQDGHVGAMVKSSLRNILPSIKVAKSDLSHETRASNHRFEDTSKLALLLEAISAEPIATNSDADYTTYSLSLAASAGRANEKEADRHQGQLPLSSIGKDELEPDIISGDSDNKVAPVSGASPVPQVQSSFHSSQKDVSAFQPAITGDSLLPGAIPLATATTAAGAEMVETGVRLLAVTSTAVAESNTVGNGLQQENFALMVVPAPESVTFIAATESTSVGSGQQQKKGITTKYVPAPQTPISGVPSESANLGYEQNQAIRITETISEPATSAAQVKIAEAGNAQPQTTAPKIETIVAKNELTDAASIIPITSGRTQALSATSVPQTVPSVALAAPPIVAASTNERAPQAPGQKKLAVSSHIQGGIFDDAESDEEAIITPISEKTQTTNELTSPPKGGIFDDADEDVSFDIPSYGQTAATQAQSMIPSSAIVEATTFPKVDPILMPKPTSVSLPLTTSAPPAKKIKQDKTTAKTGEEKKSAPKKKKKKPTKPTKRVLVARKETEAAALAMKGKDDLADILARDHSRFLGKEFWIFTVQQLETVLKSTNKLPDDGCTSITIESSILPKKNSEYQLRKELLAKLVKSHLVVTLDKPVPEGDKEQTKPTKPSPHLSTNDSSKTETSPEDATAQSLIKEAREGTVAGVGGNDCCIGEKPEGVAVNTVSVSMNHEANEADGTPFNLPDAQLNATGAVIANAEILSNDLNDGYREAAGALLRIWQSKIDSWRASDKSQNIPIETKFLLSGPISCLFPTFAQRFFASVPILTLYDFLCLKKTETGAIIALCCAWRKENKLPHATPLSIAKHFCAMGLRVELAIASLVPPDATSRIWLLDPICVLTGAGKEFAIEGRKIYSGVDFIETRTKDLANGLVEWRTRKGLPPLKGSGKVAMISGWKASVKEAVDLEQAEGKVLVGVNLQALVELSEEALIVAEEKNKVPQPAKQVPQQEFTFDPRIPDVEAALHSTKFLKELLETKHFAALEEAGIKTADKLFSAPKNQGSPLAIAVTKILPDPETFELVVFDWCQIVRKKLSGIRRVHEKKRKDPPVPASTTTSEPNLKKGRPSERKSAPQPPRPSKQELSDLDVFFSLSPVTQTFLSSLGITSAAHFMTSRTTDISSAFVVWREKHQMSVLKGLGAIASISGFKAQIRKIARERGLQDLAEMAPGGPPVSPAKAPIITKAKPVVVHQKLKVTSGFESKVISSSKGRITRPDILFGKSSHRVVVESTRDPRLRFFFELSIKKKSSGAGLFCTFQGVKKLQSLSNTASLYAPRRYVSLSPSSKFQVVRDISKLVKRGIHSTSTPGKDVNVSFSSLEDGGGLIELSRHQVGPLPHQGEAAAVLPAIAAFITEPNLGQEEMPARDEPYATNIVTGKDQNGNAQYFLFLKGRMEKGQTLELNFCGPPSDPANLHGGQQRSLIEGIIMRLSDEGLRSLLEDVALLISNKVESKLWGTGNETSAESDNTNSDKVEDVSLIATLVVARRRGHWLASRILSRLQELQMRKGASSDEGVAFVQGFFENHGAILWTPQLAAKLKEHPAWSESIVDVITKEIEDELECAMEKHSFLNTTSRQRWCTAGDELLELASQTIPKLNLLDDYSPQEAIADLQCLAEAFAKELISQQTDTDSSKDLDRFRMAFQGDDAFDSTPSDSYLFQTSVAQGYNDALTLCGTSGFDIPLPKTQAQQMIATSPPPGWANNDTHGAKPHSVEALFRTPADVKEGLATLNIAWYTRFQILLPLHSLLFCSFMVPEYENEIPFRTVAMREIEAAIVEAGVKAGSWVGATQFSALTGAPLAYPSPLGGSTYEPRSLPLFLGLVWPTLLLAHWKMEVGDLPSDVMFLPPGQRARRYKGDKRTRMQKQERTKSRIKFAKASNEVGLGFVPKLSKRLFVTAVETEALNLKHVRESEEIATVAQALMMFAAKVVGDVTDDDDTLQERVEKVVDYIRESFDEIFPSLLSDELKQDYESLDSARPSDTAGCEYLMRFLLVLPSILGQVGLSSQLVEDTTEVIKELANFLAMNHQDLFDVRFHPPMEVYATSERRVPSVLASRLENLRAEDEDSGSEKDIDIILPEDRPDLTDFVDLVMSQVVFCKASQDDVEKKHRRISLGRVGLMCRHCLGVRGDGRSFFSSVESITTAATVIEKHIQKCPDVSFEIKSRMSECRSRHGEQRRNLSPGAQASFFLRLWGRLKSSKVKDTDKAAALHILEMNEKEEDEDEEDSTGLDFECHVRLIDYLSKTLPWREKPSIVQALDRYYEGLDKGHRLYTANTKPREFTSELVLAQMRAAEAKEEVTA